jgi:hypothetical protein
MQQARSDWRGGAIVDALDEAGICTRDRVTGLAQEWKLSHPARPSCELLLARHGGYVQ